GEESGRVQPGVSLLPQHAGRRALSRRRLEAGHLGPGTVRLPRQRRQQPRLVLSGHGPLAARREGEGTRVVRPGRVGQGAPGERGTPPLPGGSRGVVGCEREERSGTRRQQSEVRKETLTPDYRLLKTSGR